MMVVCLLLMLRPDCWYGDGNGGGCLTVNLMLCEMQTKQLQHAVLMKTGCHLTRNLMIRLV